MSTSILSQIETDLLILSAHDTFDSLFKYTDRIIRERGEEIESLRKSVNYWREDSAAAWDKCEERRLEAESLRTQLAECQKERDKLREHKRKYDEWLSDGVYFTTAEYKVEVQNLTAAQARIAELVELLRLRNNSKISATYDRMCNEAVSRTDNMEALQAYRDNVIQEYINNNTANIK